MNWVFCDLDATLVDTKSLLDKGGPEPLPGTEEHYKWVKTVTDPNILENAAYVSTIYNLIHNVEIDYHTRLVFITNRQENTRKLTQHWLHKAGFYQQLFMRPLGLITSAGEFKASVIKDRIHSGDNVIVIDDDPDGSIEKACKENRWTHLKVTSY